MTQSPDRRAWAHHLRAIAAPTVGDESPLPPGEGLRPFLIARERLVSRAAPPIDDTMTVDAALWWAAVDGSLDIDAQITGNDGPLRRQEGYRTLEVWTEAELSGMHALHRLARLRDRPDLLARLDAAARWHLEHTQPDNATNRPWALHVFLLTGEPAGIHYADTLLHNCRAVNGEPDPLSRLILCDSADELER